MSRARRSLRGTARLLSSAIPPLLAGIAVRVWDEAVPSSIGLTRVRARRTTEVRSILLHAHYSPRSSQGAFADRLQTGTATQRRGTERGAVWQRVLVSTSQLWREFFSILGTFRFLSDFPRVSDANCHIRPELPATRRASSHTTTATIRQLHSITYQYLFPNSRASLCLPVTSSSQFLNCGFVEAACRLEIG